MLVAGVIESDTGQRQSNVRYPRSQSQYRSTVAGTPGQVMMTMMTMRMMRMTMTMMTGQTKQTMMDEWTIEYWQLVGQLKARNLVNLDVDDGEQIHLDTVNAMGVDIDIVADLVDENVAHNVAGPSLAVSDPHPSTMHHHLHNMPHLDHVAHNRVHHSPVDRSPVGHNQHTRHDQQRLCADKYLANTR